MDKNERLMKNRQKAIDMIAFIKKSQFKVARHLGKIKQVDLEEIAKAAELVKNHKSLLESVDIWVRKNNDLLKELISFISGKLILTDEERECLEHLNDSNM